MDEGTPQPEKTQVKITSTIIQQEGVELHEQEEEARRKARDEEFQRKRQAANTATATATPAGQQQPAEQQQQQPGRESAAQEKQRGEQQQQQALRHEPNPDVDEEQLPPQATSSLSTRSDDEARTVVGQYSPPEVSSCKSFSPRVCCWSWSQRMWRQVCSVEAIRLVRITT